MAVKSLHTIYEDRNIETSIDENTLTAGETSAGVFGVFKLSKGIKKLNKFKTTEEQIGVWIDGKPLYRKVVDIASFGSGTTVDIAHGISNLKLITNSIIVLTSGNGTFYPLPWTHGGYAGYHINRSVITFWFSSSWSGYTGKAILEYTKTTD